MITLGSPTLLFWFTFVLLLIGVLTFVWGRNLPARGGWLLWTGLLLFLVGAGLESGIFFREDFHTKVWVSGWILSRNDPGAITLGVFQDLFGVTFFVLSTLVSAGFLLNGGFFRHSFPERTLAALAISTSGIALVSIALTPWLVFVGLLLTILGGGLSFGTHWDVDSEAKIAARFLWESSIGFLLAFFGACVLASAGFSLFLNETGLWSAGDTNITSALVGSVLLMVGLFVQFHPFPLLGWVVAESRQCSPQRVLLNQIFPAWAAFVLLLRLEHQFRGLGLFPHLGWVAWASAVLAVLSGFFQKGWRGALGLWLVAGFSLSCAVLAFSGKIPALALLLGVSLSALTQSNLGTALDEKAESTSASTRTKAAWLKGLSFLAAASGTGLLGFVSMAGGLQWIARAIDSPAVATAFLFLLFLFVFLGWRIAWKMNKLSATSNASWAVFFSSALWLLLSVAVLWTGTGTGGAVVGSADRLLPSLLESLLGTQGMDPRDSADLFSASGFYWGSFIAACVAAYWTSGRKEDLWSRLADVFPRVTSFVEQGFKVDVLYRKLADLLIWLGRLAQNVIDKKVWSTWIPSVSSLVLEKISTVFRGMDAAISAGIGGSVRRIVEVPGKTLQLIQTGDVRWYLFFVMISGFALLAHYLKL